MSKTKRSIDWVKTKGERYAGIHLLAEFWQGKAVEDPSRLKEILITAAKKSHNIPLEVTIHQFKPHGITGVILLAESHLSIHSWPEFHYLAVDVFSCGEKGRPSLALEYLKKEFRPKKVELQIIKRGVIR